MTDVLEVLKQADPADVSRLRAEPPPQERFEAIVASDRERAARLRRPRRRMPLLVPAGGVAAGLAAAASSWSARRVRVDTLADTAREQPPTLPPGDHRFLFFRTESRGYLAMASEPPFHRGIRTEDDFGFLLDFRSTQEVWIGEDGGRVRNRGEAPTFASRHDREVWEAAGRPKLPPAHDQASPLSGGLERLDLPTDPDALLDRLEKRAAEEGNGEAWIFTTLITDYLREWGVTPDQRAALLDAAARVPGIELLGERTDPAGRSGVGFAMVDDEEHARHTLIIDPGTGELLAELWQTVAGGPIPAGARGYTVFRAPVLVGSIGERP